MRLHFDLYDDGDILICMMVINLFAYGADYIVICTTFNGARILIGTTVITC